MRGWGASPGASTSTIVPKGCSVPGKYFSPWPARHHIQLGGTSRPTRGGDQRPPPCVGVATNCALGLFFDFDQISTRPESPKLLRKFCDGNRVAAEFRSGIVCCKLWRKRHASDRQSDSARCYRCWPRGHSCDVAIGNTDGERVRLARLNPTRYRPTALTALGLGQRMSGLRIDAKPHHALLQGSSEMAGLLLSPPH